MRCQGCGWPHLGGGVVLLPPLLSPLDDLAKQPTVQLEGGWCVVVARDGVGYEVGIAVAVHHADTGDVAHGSLLDGRLAGRGA